MTAAARQQIEAQLRAAEAAIAAAREQLAALSDEADEERQATADDLLEVSVAAERFGVRPDTLRKRLRSDPALGEKHGGRWYVRITRLQQCRSAPQPR